MEEINMLNVMSHKNQRGHTSCWHDSRSWWEPHHHPAPWDNWRKARALWVMLLINSIQQTLRRYDYLSRTAPLSPAMLIIVNSTRIPLCLYLISLVIKSSKLLSAKSLMIKWSNGWWMTWYYEMKILLAITLSLNISCKQLFGDFCLIFPSGC